MNTAAMNALDCMSEWARLLGLNAPASANETALARILYVHYTGGTVATSVSQLNKLRCFQGIAQTLSPGPNVAHQNELACLRIICVSIVGTIPNVNDMSALDCLRAIVNSPLVSFTPASIAGMELWLKADSLVGTGLLNGDPVTTWQDNSGNGRNATQSAGAAKPSYITGAVGVLPAVRFDGVADYLTSTLEPDGDYTIFVVARLLTDGGVLPANVSAGRSGGADADLLFHWYRNSFATPPNDMAYTAGPTPTGRLLNGSETLTTEAATWYIGETLVAGVSLGGATAFERQVQIGVLLNDTGIPTFFADIDCAEVLIYSGHLTAANLTSVREWLGTKWAITLA